ncbi:hypothetical protein GAH_01560 [Geoglobus ahangari]|uniref:Uncharacterized protein n=1 Tax=Geoglobus ahangari TaxID=113653 RepID=A0A0F7ICZ7_9EURY|nr:hypothetical protein [Geoglobus ahangari]AKG91152.1 hypothetical protein GAH_01560 [Geoglobus ahangari]
MVRCIYDSTIECIEGEPEREKCRKCPIYEAVVEGAKGCGSVEF